jgi:hypothetical protein
LRAAWVITFKRAEAGMAGEASLGAGGTTLPAGVRGVGPGQ